MKAVIVLAMHGSPPIDFPPKERTELFDLRARLKHSKTDPGPSHLRHEELDAKMRSWPRTAENDPFYTGSHELADHLRRQAGYDVIVGFNEFCGPTVDEALEHAIQTEAEKIIVLTPMMTKGGEHSKIDIPAAISRAQKRHPQASIHYAWPFDTSEIAQFLASQIKRFI